MLITGTRKHAKKGRKKHENGQSSDKLKFAARVEGVCSRIKDPDVDDARTSNINMENCRKNKVESRPIYSPITPVLRIIDNG